MRDGTARRRECVGDMGNTIHWGPMSLGYSHGHGLLLRLTRQRKSVSLACAHFAFTSSEVGVVSAGLMHMKPRDLIGWLRHCCHWNLQCGMSSYRGTYVGVRTCMRRVCTPFSHQGQKNVASCRHCFTPRRVAKYCLPKSMPCPTIPYHDMGYCEAHSLTRTHTHSRFALHYKLLCHHRTAIRQHLARFHRRKLVMRLN